MNTTRSIRLVMPPRGKRIQNLGLASAARDLHSAMENILNGWHGHLSFEECYRACYNLVLHGEGDFVYQLLHRAVRRTRGLPRSETVEVLVMLHDVNMFLERVYIKRNHLPGTFALAGIPSPKETPLAPPRMVFRRGL